MLLLSLFPILVQTSFLITLPACDCQLIYYVRPIDAPSSTCPGKPCNDIDYYAANAASLLSGKNSSVMLLFSGGAHFLTQILEISNTVSMQMSKVDTPLDSEAIVNIAAGVNIRFFHLNTLHLSNLTFLGNQCQTTDSNFSTSVTQAWKFSQLNITTVCCELYLSLVSEVELQYSQYRVNSSITLANSYEAVYLLAHSLPLVSNFSSALNIDHCLFLNDSNLNVKMDNKDNPVQFILFNGSISDTSGFYINFDVTEEQHIFLEIRNCLSDRKLSATGSFSNSISNNSSNFELIIANCSVSEIFIYADNKKNRILSLVNCLLLDSNLLSQHFFSDITINNCLLQHTAVYFTALEVGSFVYVTFDNCFLYLRGPSRATFEETKFFSGNESLINTMPMQSPFIVSNVDLTFLGEVIFENNTGYQGGALYMFDSNIYLGIGTKLTFSNNKAYDKGGAVYVDNPMNDAFSVPNDLLQPAKCSISLNYNSDIPNSSVIFGNNNALNGGNDLYGLSLKSNCWISPNKETHSYEIRSKIFKFSNKSQFTISSEPRRVCLCENKITQCTNYSYIFQQRQYVPGEKVSIRLSLVGDDFGTTIGTLYLLALPSESQDGHYSERKEELQEVMSISVPTCSDIEYTVHSRSETGSLLYFISAKIINMDETMKQQFIYINESLEVYKDTGRIDNRLASTPVVLNVTLRECPLGFTLNLSLQVCQCKVPKRNGNTKCDIVNGEGRVYRNGTTWVSATIWPPVNGKSVEVFFYDYCPYGYCKTKEIAVNLQQPDSQCDLNRTGTLCGGCATNMSLALGSRSCIPCSGNGLVEIILAFVFAGIFLICFIKLLNFTITTGTINGLVLYANILWTSQSVFFPYTLLQSSTPLHLFAIFIAWVNLDLGIQTSNCFIHGLDTYWKTWLQFLFPLYIWSLAGLIIMACHFSVKITRLFGTNSVHVLATMFLLSYSKILRTITTSLGFALLNYQNETRIVWLADGNLPYFELPHSFLFVAALLFLIVFWIPYTTTILLVPCLRRHFNIAWINKLTPFYDAHFGPLKHKHQYWIGLTLLVRVILAVSEIAVQAIDPTINIYITIIVSTFLCLIVCIVYKKWYLSFLEASFLVNLIILNCGFLYSRDGHTRVILASVSVGVAFITFLVILFSQGFVRIKSFCLYIRTACFHRGYEDLDTVHEPESDARNSPTQSVVSVGGIQSQDHVSFREPLLDDS